LTALERGMHALKSALSAPGYLYRAVDGTGPTIDFLLSAKRDKQAARRFFRRALGRENTRNPRVVVTDRLKSYPGALREMKQKSELWRFVRHRRGRWLNNMVEQDHRRIKRRTRPMLAKGQVRAARADDMLAQRACVHQIFDLVA
jgi:transposase-like protein